MAACIKQVLPAIGIAMLLLQLGGCGKTAPQILELRTHAPQEEVQAPEPVESAPPPAPVLSPPPLQTGVYKCIGGYNFVARFEGRKVWLFLPRETISLPLAVSGSGARYSDGETTFWIKGERAFLDTGPTRRLHCENNRAEAVWEHAKLNGVDFRGVGNSPAWVLEITRGKKTVFTIDNGRVRHSFPTPEPDSDRRTGRTTYTMQNGKQTMTVLLMPHGCRDTANGEWFATTVTVTVNGRTYQGCGRPLH